MNTQKQKPLLLTTGEPAGIGPDIVLQLWQQRPEIFNQNNIHVAVDETLLYKRAKQLGITLSDNAFPIVHIHLKEACTAGKLDTANAPYVMEMLTYAVENCVNHKYAGLITGPIHKGILNDAGFKIAGHTDFLTRATNTQRTVMMLMTQQLRVALLTDHVPLKNVPDFVTEENLSNCIDIILDSGGKLFNKQKLRILVCGFNPHAGEGGHLGSEEKTVISPTIEKYQDAGHQIIGPISADIAFTPKWREKADIILAMYHDQGLPTLKYAGFHQAINVTLGLPFLRTSVDHGTALDLAGTGHADYRSLYEAIQLANNATLKPKE